MKGMSGHQSANSKTDEWLTDPKILQALGPFDLDPCAPVVRPWPMATKHLTIEDNGLLCPWEGFVWMNPPYGRNTGAWLNRLALHGNGIALIFARTDTIWFHTFGFNMATSMLYIYNRLYFYTVEGNKGHTNAGAPSVLIAYGPEADQRLKNCKIKGKYLPMYNLK